MPRCLYYAQLAFTCRKYFPKCTNTTVYVGASTWSKAPSQPLNPMRFSSGKCRLLRIPLPRSHPCPPLPSPAFPPHPSGGNNTLVPLCRTTCQAGQRWEFQSNVCYEDIVDEECAAVEFGAGPPPACYDYAFPEIDGGSAKWKWIVGGTMIGVGGLIGIWLLVQYIRKRRVNPEITDAVIDQPFKHEKAAIKRGTWTGAMPPVNSRPELVPTMGGSGAGDNSGAAYAAPAGGAHGHSGYAHQYGALPVAESTGAGGVYAPAPSAYAGAGYPSSASSSGAGAGAGAGTVGMGAGAGLGPGMGGPRPPHVSHGSAHVVGTGGAGYDIEMSQTDPSAPLRR